MKPLGSKPQKIYSQCRALCPPKAQKLEAFTSLGQLSLAADISAHISGHKKPTKFSKATWNEEEVMVL